MPGREETSFVAQDQAHGTVFGCSVLNRLPRSERGWGYLDQR